MPLERYKDVTIRDRMYRLGRVPANIGSWAGAMIMAGKAGDFETYQKIKDYVFSEISIYEDPGNGVPIPKLLYRNGRFLDPMLGLEYDLDLFDEIFEQAFEFNFDDFFKKRKAEADKLKAERELSDSNR